MAERAYSSGERVKNSHRTYYNFVAVHIINKVINVSLLLLKVLAETISSSRTYLYRLFRNR
jgi:hypothetical protein